MRTVQEIMAENGSLANIERFQTMQKWDYKRKVEHAQEMAEAFYCWDKDHDKGVHLSVGGLDSITLHYFLESIGLPVTCVSCSSLEGNEPSGSYMDPPTCAIGGCYLKRPPQSLCYVEVQD